MKYKINQEVIVTSIADTVYTHLMLGVYVTIEDRNPEKGLYIVSISGVKGMCVTFPETHLSPATQKKL